jgi:hypothetical protein
MPRILGFSDCLILETARKAGHLPLGTFDRISRSSKAPKDCSHPATEKPKPFERRSLKSEPSENLEPVCPRRLRFLWVLPLRPDYILKVGLTFPGRDGPRPCTRFACNLILHNRDTKRWHPIRSQSEGLTYWRVDEYEARWNHCCPFSHVTRACGL